MKPGFLICLSVIFLFSCTPVKKVSTSANAKGLDKYKTYSWVKTNDPKSTVTSALFYSDTNDVKIKEQVSLMLETKGLVVKDAADADASVSYCILKDDKLSSLLVPYGTEYKMGQSSGYAKPGDLREWLFMAGTQTLIIDLADSKTNQLIWRGWDTQVIAAGSKNNLDSLLPAGVLRIFQRYPSN